MLISCFFQSKSSQNVYLEELLLSCNFCCCRGFIGNNFLLCFRFILVSLSLSLLVSRFFSRGVSCLLSSCRFFCLSSFFALWFFSCLLYWGLNNLLLLGLNNGGFRRHLYWKSC